MRKQIEIRAHHLLCIPRFYSGGYDRKFAENMKRICLAIRKNPDVRIKLVIGKLDDLCRKCPYKSGDICRNPEEPNKWVVLEDKKVARYLGLKKDSLHKAKDIFNLSVEKLDDKHIKDICKRCPFMYDCLKVGINNSFVKDINKN